MLTVLRSTRTTILGKKKKEKEDEGGKIILEVDFEVMIFRN